MKGFNDKLGITHDHVTKGPMALIMSDDRDFTPEEWERFTENHWAGFNSWLRDVADRRGMTFEEAEKLAHGRVWSGRQGKANGLIDEVGDLDDAIAMAKSLAGIPEDEKVTVVHYPKEKDFLSSLFGGDADATTALRWVVYRLLHDELSEEISHATAGYTYMMDPVTVE
jgi:protease-4